MMILICFASRLFAASGGSLADSTKFSGKSGKFNVRFELKREFTNRGTLEESSKSSLKVDFRFSGIVTLLRLEMPFPDQETDFDGSAFKPCFGDIKTRIGFKAVKLGLPVASFIELTFPTASPSQLGTGKYQCSAGIRTSLKLSREQTIEQSHRFTLDFQVQQVFSYAGDPDRKDINYTKFEISCRDTWKKRLYLKMTAKPVVDWVKSGSTGAVLEIEPGWLINHHWSLWIMGGQRLWGEGIPGTYDKKISLGMALLI